jgi:hypothetical protein
VSGRLIKVTKALLDKGTDCTTPDGQTIPLEAAQDIIGELKAAFPRRTARRLFMQRAIRVYESLNARPAGLVATVLFSAVFAASLWGAVRYGIGLPGSNFGILARLMPDEAPQHALKVAEIERWNTEDANAEDGGATFVVASFSNRARAEVAAHYFLADATFKVPLELFGDTLIAKFPARQSDAVRHCVDYLKQTADKVTSGVAEKLAIGLWFRSLSHSAGKPEVPSLINDCARDSGIAQLWLIPPWSPEDRRSESQKAHDELARKTLAACRDAVLYADQDPALRDSNDLWQKAERSGDIAKANQIFNEQEKLLPEIRRRAVLQLRNRGPDEVDQDVLNRYIAIEDKNSWPVADSPEMVAREVTEIGPLLGQLPMAATQPSAPARRFSVGEAYYLPTDGYMDFTFFDFEDFFEAAPAIARWLDAEGYFDLRYNLSFYSIDDAGDTN